MLAGEIPTLGFSLIGCPIPEVPYPCGGGCHRRLRNRLILCAYLGRINAL
jgi:hypothetical protein